MSIFFINLSIQQIWSGCATENTTVNKIDKVTIIAFVLVSYCCRNKLPQMQCL